MQVFNDSVIPVIPRDLQSRDIRANVQRRLDGADVPGEQNSGIALQPGFAALNSILQKYYTPVMRGPDGLVPLVNNASPPVSQQPIFDYYMFSAKLDQIINDKHRISGSYSYAARPREKIDQTRAWSQADTAAGTTELCVRTLKRP